MARKPRRGIRSTKSGSTSKSSSGKNQQENHAVNGVGANGTSARVDRDLYHNGQTPACQLLVRACYDVFPELRYGYGTAPRNFDEEELDDERASMRANRSGSGLKSDDNNVNQIARSSGSLLGQMLRWYMIQKRQEAARTQQALIEPLQGGGQDSNLCGPESIGAAEDEGDDPNPPAQSTSKKRRKKKRKKKAGAGGGGQSQQQQQQSDQQQDDASLAGTFATFEGDDWPDNTSNPHGSNSQHNSVKQLNNSFTQQLNDHNNNRNDTYEEPMNTSLSQLSGTPSTEELQVGGVDTLDQSLHRQSRLRELKSSRVPRLDSLPSDDAILEEDEKQSQRQSPHPNPKSSPKRQEPSIIAVSSTTDESANHQQPKVPHIPSPIVGKESTLILDNQDRGNQDDMEKLHSSTHFFQQILPQDEEEDNASIAVEFGEPSHHLPELQRVKAQDEGYKEDVDKIVNSPTTGVLKTASPIVQTPVVDRHASGGSGKDSNEEGKEMPTNGKDGGSSSGKDVHVPRTLSHDLIPQESAMSVPETPPAEVIKNPLDVPYLVSLDSHDAPWTLTIEGHHVATTSLAQKDGNAAKGDASKPATEALYSQDNPQNGSSCDSLNESKKVGENSNDTSESNNDEKRQQPPPPPPPPPLRATEDLSSGASVQKHVERSIFEEWLDRVVVEGEIAAATEKQQLQLDPHGMINSSAVLQSPLANNRNLDSFLSYLQNRFHVGLRRGQGSASKAQPQKSAKQPQQQRKQFGHGIPVSSVVNACNEIECDRCRQSAMDFLNGIQESFSMAMATTKGASSTQDDANGVGASNDDHDKSLTSQRHCCLVLNPESLKLVRQNDIIAFSPFQKKDEEMAVQAAFDYVALEEGHHVPSFPANNSGSILGHGHDDVVVLVGGDREPTVDLDKLISFVPSNDDFRANDINDSSASSDNPLVSKNSTSQKGVKNSLPGQQKLNRKDELYIQELGLNHVESLVWQWLPCGMEEDSLLAMTKSLGRDREVVPTDSVELPPPNREKELVMGPDDVRDLQIKVLDNVATVRRYLDEMMDIGLNIKEDFIKLESSIQTNGSSSNVSPKRGKKYGRNIEIAAFDLMRGIDTKCFDYMRLMLSILKLTTSERSITLHGMQLDLWKCYLRALGEILTACEQFYAKYTELADQLGELPKGSLSAPLRDHFRDLLHKKRQSVAQPGEIFASELTSPVLKELFTRQAWHDFHGSGGDDEASDAMMLDDNCHELITRLLEWTDTIFDHGVERVQRQRMQSTEHVLEQLQKIVDPLSKEYVTVERFFTPERNRYFASLRSNICLAKSVKHQMRLIDQNEIEWMATGAVLMWRQVRITQIRMRTILQDPALSPQLTTWMQSEDGVDPGALEGFGWQAPDHLCLAGAGSGGKRRVMCVLAGLVYQWLDDRCQEWNAELAEQELLTSMDSEKVTIPSVSSAAGQAGNSTNTIKGKSGKSKKKSKKQREKNKASTSGSASPINGSPDDTAEVPADTKQTSDTPQAPPAAVEEAASSEGGEKESLETQDRSLNQKPQKAKEEITDSTDQEPIDETPSASVADTDSAQVGHGDEPEAAQKSPHQREPTGEVREEPLEDSSAELELAYQSTVGVIDLNDFEPAETFLVARFKDLQKLGVNEEIVYL